jgi:hypothetical protein
MRIDLRDAPLTYTPDSELFEPEPTAVDGVMLVPIGNAIYAIDLLSGDPEVHRVLELPQGSMFLSGLHAQTVGRTSHLLACACDAAGSPFLVTLSPPRSARNVIRLKDAPWQLQFPPGGRDTSAPPSVPSWSGAIFTGDLCTVIGPDSIRVARFLRTGASGNWSWANVMPPSPALSFDSARVAIALAPPGATPWPRHVLLRTTDQDAGLTGLASLTVDRTGAWVAPHGRDNANVTLHATGGRLYGVKRIGAGNVLELLDENGDPRVQQPGFRGLNDKVLQVVSVGPQTAVLVETPFSLEVLLYTAFGDSINSVAQLRRATVFGPLMRIADHLALCTLGSDGLHCTWVPMEEC